MKYLLIKNYISTIKALWFPGVACERGLTQVYAGVSTQFVCAQGEDSQAVQ